MKFEIEYNETKHRYELEFEKNAITWFMFLNVEVMKDPIRFKDWMRTLMITTQKETGHQGR